MKLETCHKNWLVAYGNGSVCDGRGATVESRDEARSTPATPLPDACGAHVVFEMEILGMPH